MIPTTMEKYISPDIRIEEVDAAMPLLAGSNRTLTGGGSNAGQSNPTAESRPLGGLDDDIWMDDEDI